LFRFPLSGYRSIVLLLFLLTCLSFYLVVLKIDIIFDK
jgi:hypothetical protein